MYTSKQLTGPTILALASALITLCLVTTVNCFTYIHMYAVYSIQCLIHDLSHMIFVELGARMRLTTLYCSVFLHVFVLEFLVF